MKAVLDTNALLVSISRKSRLHPVFQAFEDKRYDLLVTTDILNEYEEIIGEEMGPLVASALLDGLRVMPNVTYLIKYFRWQLIVADPDDDKFVDCAIAGNADFIVSNDRHFRALKKIGFPVVRVVTIEEFYEILTGDKITLGKT